MIMTPAQFRSHPDVLAIVERTERAFMLADAATILTLAKPLIERECQGVSSYIDGIAQSLRQEAAISLEQRH